jgi:hypothetical protein
MAALLDAENARALMRLGSEEAAAKVEDAFARRFDEDEAAEQLLIENVSPSELDTVPEEVARREIESRRTGITLADVHMFPPGGAHFELSILRVRLASVAGWWLLPSDDEGKVSFHHPT